MRTGGWFSRRGRASSAESVPDGVAIKCEGCEQILFARELERNLRVCPRCGYHHRIGAMERLAITVDEGTFVETDADLVSVDPLQFPEYPAKLERARETSGLREAIVTGEALLEGMPIVIGVVDFGFMGGSMGSVYGEKVARAMERAAETRRPVILFSASGGARMQEGLLALMQMAKTAAAVRRAADRRTPYISVLTNPTTGGVFASYASLGDVVLAEPGAIVGFAGRRVGQQDLAGQLPDNFQTSEFQWEHGFVDRIVARKDMRRTLAYLLRFFCDRQDGE